MNLAVTEQPTREAIVRLVVEHMSAALKRRLAVDPRVSLIVSGGSTPAPVYELLSGEILDWCRVDVCLTDERCVDRSHSASNERMLRERLLINLASAANFVPLETAAVAALPKPSACTLLGMGEDGHFASLFPGSAALQVALDTATSEPVVCVADAPDRLERISLTLRQLVASDKLMLLVFGRRKREILHAPEAYPVQSLLAQTISPVHVFWAP